MKNAIVYNPAKWLDQFFNDFDRPWTSPKNEFYPAVEILDEKDQYTLKVELPGVSNENIKVEVKENTLTLSGKKETTFSNQGEYNYSEFRYGTFSRRFELPRGVTGESITAEHINGVLTLSVPKAKESLSRMIEIKTS